MSVKWMSTKFKGVRYYESNTRRNGVRKDRYYAIRYQYDGTRKEEGLGWESDGWTAEKSALVLADLRKAHTTGDGAYSLKEKREKAKLQRDIEEKEKIRHEKENITFAQYFEKVYYPNAILHKKVSTYDKEELHNRLWITPILGQKTFKDINRLDLVRLKKKLLDDHKSFRTLQYVFATFNQVWNMARSDGLTSKDSPTKKVKTPKFDNKRQRFLNHDEEIALLTSLKIKSSQVHHMALLSLRTGMRASEIFNLRWSHVDIESGRIMIMDAKGDKSRVAFMTQDIKSLFKQTEQKGPNDYVFPSSKGGRMKEVSDTFTRVVNELKLNEGISDSRYKVCFHTCRHTFASRLAELGVDLYIIKNLLGHSTITLTERYSHLGEGTLQNAIRTLEQGITKTRENRDNVVSLNSKK